MCFCFFFKKNLYSIVTAMIFICQTDPSVPLKGQNEQHVLLHNRTCCFIPLFSHLTESRQKSAIDWGCLHWKPALSTNWACKQDGLERWGTEDGRGSQLDAAHSLTTWENKNISEFESLQEEKGLSIQIQHAVWEADSLLPYCSFNNLLHWH